MRVKFKLVNAIAKDQALKMDSLILILTKILVIFKYFMKLKWNRQNVNKI